MFWYLVIAALVNAGLGYAVALAVTRSRTFRTMFTDQPAPNSWEERVDAVHASAAIAQQPATGESPPTERAERLAQSESSPTSESAAEPFVTPPSREEVPRAWLEMLGEHLQTHSFVEAAAHIVRLDVTRYREELVRIDGTLRREGEQISSVVLGNLQVEVLQTNQDWLTRQTEAAAHLRSRQESSRAADAAATGLEAALLDQAAHIRDVDCAIARQDYHSHPAAGAKQLLYEIGGLLDHCHSLRDRTHESLVTVLRQEARLDALKPALQVDPLTLLRSRAALEMLLESWWRDDPFRHRLASVALIDLDRLSDVNRQFGPVLADRLICALAGVTRDGFRRNRGYDVVGRFTGQQFFVFLGDTGPQGATTAVERLRQTIQAAAISTDGTEIPVCVSCGVVEILPGDTAASLLQRTQETLFAAKAAGGNQTLLHDGVKPAPVAPPTFSVVLHTLRLDCDSASMPATPA